MFSLTNATRWLSSTASRLFSSSGEDIHEKSIQIHEPEPSTCPITKRGRGRPRKNPNDPKIPKLVPEPRKMGQRRSSVLRSRDLRREEIGPNDGQVRFLLTFNTLPKNLQIIAKTLYPPTHNKYEEHRLVCKILNEDENTRRREIFIPTFRKLPRARTTKESEKEFNEKVHLFKQALLL